MKKQQILFIAYIIILLLVFFYFINTEILIPTRYSIIEACLTEEQANVIYEKDNVEVKTVGSTTVYYNESNKTQITDIQIINVNNDTKTFRHEHIHEVQALQGRLYGCCNVRGKYWNEIEAYVGEWYPRWVYDWVYSNP